MAGTGCQVDFYVLGPDTPGQLDVARRLTMMAWERGHRVTLLVADEAQAAVVDAHWWDTPGRFLPHAVAEGDGKASAPVEIRHRTPAGGGELAINLTDTPLPADCDFQRVLEFVPTEPERRAAAREKYKAYRSRGIEPATHTLKR